MTMPCTRSVTASASRPPNIVYATHTAAATITSAVVSSGVTAPSTCAKPRSCAPAQNMELGIMMSAAARSTAGE